MVSRLQARSGPARGGAGVGLPSSARVARGVFGIARVARGFFLHRARSARGFFARAARDFYDFRPRKHYFLMHLCISDIQLLYACSDPRSTLRTVLPTVTHNPLPPPPSPLQPSPSSHPTPPFPLPLPPLPVVSVAAAAVVAAVAVGAMVEARYNGKVVVAHARGRAPWMRASRRAATCCSAASARREPAALRAVPARAAAQPPIRATRTARPLTSQQGEHALRWFETANAARAAPPPHHLQLCLPSVRREPAAPRAVPARAAAQPPIRATRTARPLAGQQGERSFETANATCAPPPPHHLGKSCSARPHTQTSAHPAHHVARNDPVRLPVKWHQAPTRFELGATTCTCRAAAIDSVLVVGGSYIQQARRLSARLNARFSVRPARDTAQYQPRAAHYETAASMPAVQIARRRGLDDTYLRHIW